MYAKLLSNLADSLVEIVVDRCASNGIPQYLGLPQNTYIQERSQAVDSINKTIAELGTIFTQLATMVHEQGQLAQR